MKKYLLAFALIALGTSFCMAQTQNTTEGDSTQTTDSVQYTSSPQIIVPNVNIKHTSPYYQTFKPFTMSANSTANAYPNVVGTRNGISIKGGREDGNAYYFNGVRIMDNTPAIVIPQPTFDIK